MNISQALRRVINHQYYKQIFWSFYFGYPADSAATFVNYRMNNDFDTNQISNSKNPFDGTGFIPSKADLEKYGEEGLLKFIAENRICKEVFPEEGEDPENLGDTIVNAIESNPIHEQRFIQIASTLI